MTQHTPGPWFRSNEHPAHQGGMFTGRVLTVVTPRGDYQIKSGWFGAGIPEEEHAANARLIAAAPELLAALQRVVHELQALQECNGWQECLADSDDTTLLWVGPRVMKAFDVARAAIARAEGE